MKPTQRTRWTPLSRLALAFAVVLSSALTPARASHFGAVDMHIDYIGTGPTNLQYKITLTVYKACEVGGINLSPTATITIGSPSCGLTVPSVIADTIGNNTNDTLDQLCGPYAGDNSCYNPSSIYPGFVRYVYTAVVTLPQACPDWTFTWSSGSRNSGISNLCNPGGQNIRVQVVLNNLLQYSNSSPRFVVEPVPYFCINQPVQFFNGPVDPDLDSIVVENVQPRGCAAVATCTPNTCPPTLEIPYSGGYTLANPVNSSTGYTVNPATGVASFTPSSAGKFVVALRASEYDPATGTFKGSITRDVQVNVLVCAATPPAIDSLPINAVGGNLNGNTILTCPDAVVTFEASATGTGPASAIVMTHTGPAASTLSVVGQGTPNPVATFSWTPTTADIGDHIVIIQARDSNCNAAAPIIFSSYLTVFIKVVEGVNAGPDRTGYCALNGDPIQLSASGAPGIGYNWTKLDGSVDGIVTPTSQNPLVTTTQNTEYVVFTTDLPPVCKTRDTVLVAIDKTNDVVITPASPFVQCRPGYLDLSAEGLGPRPLLALTCGPSTLPPCTAEDSVLSAPPTALLTAGSNTTTTPFYGSTLAWRTARHQYLLRKEDLRDAGLKSSTLRSLAFNITNFPTSAVYNNFRIAISCTPLNDLSAVGNFLPAGTTVYNAPGSVTLPATGGFFKFPFDVPYDWDTAQNILVDVCYANTTTTSAAYTQRYARPYAATLYGYASTGSLCAGTATAPIGPLAAFELPVMRFNFCDAPETDFEYDWSAGTYLSDSTVRTPTAYVPGSTTYVVSTVGRSGCLVRDTLQIVVPDHQFGVFPLDTTICEGDGVLLQATEEGVAFRWYEDGFSEPTTLSCTDCARPLAAPRVTTTYAVAIADALGCSDTAYVTVRIKPRPLVDIEQGDTIVKPGVRVRLLATGASLYSWSPAAGLSNPRGASTVAMPEQTTTYVVAGLAQNGCQGSDSVTITIDPRANLFVPSGFSPNGDGDNDLFRVANLSFQRLIEFKVFNRWGREVFSTTDPKGGWDGTYRGVPQDMGVYHYNIRVAIPDGGVKEFRGTVTLVR